MTKLPFNAPTGKPTYGRYSVLLVIRMTPNESLLARIGQVWDSVCVHARIQSYRYHQV